MKKRWIIKFEPSINIFHTKKRKSKSIKYKNTHLAKRSREWLNRCQENRDRHNRRQHSLHMAKNPKIVKKEKLKALVLAGFPVEIAAEKLGIKLKRVA